MCVLTRLERGKQRTGWYWQQQLMQKEKENIKDQRIESIKHDDAHATRDCKDCNYEMWIQKFAMDLMQYENEGVSHVY